MLKYYPYKSDKPDKKYYIITDNGKKVYFGAAGMSDFTIHKDEARKQRYINRHKKMKIGLYRVRIPPVFGLTGCYGINPP
jgi:DNA-binding PadR family transcriptional regulator